MEATYHISEEHAGMRLDRFLVSKMPNFSRAHLQKAVTEGLVKVGGQKRTPHFMLRNGDVVEVEEITEQQEPTVSARPDIVLDIVYEDDDVIVINKPSGLIVHPATATDKESVAHALLAHYPEIAKVGESSLRPGIVHRLDKEASGLLVTAKNQEAFETLKQQFQEHTINKEYVILVEGAPPHDEGTVDFAIGRHTRSGRMSAHAEAIEGDRHAITHYSLIEQFGPNVKPDEMIRDAVATLLKIRTETGRTHQIRVHMKAIGCPIVGDALYGNAAKNQGLSKIINSPRLFLHASILAFDHPSTGKRMSFESPITKELEKVLEKLRTL